MKHLLLLLGLMLVAGAASAQVRIKDIASVQGARSNQLVGYGFVVGLDGSGDSNSTTFTVQTVVNALQKMGVSVPANAVKLKNVASVLVTTDLPAFAKNGTRIDVTVSSLGDARSLQGGTLIQTPLKGADGEVYALAQGSITIGGFNFSGGGAQAQKNHTTAGRIPGGATVEQEVATSLTPKDGSTLDLTLNQPDFTTASRIAEAINARIPTAGAQPLDPYTVRVGIPQADRGNLIGFIARIETLSVTPDTAAKIVISERTGTIVIGGDVHIAPCVIGQGNIHVKIDNTPVVVPAAPLTNGKSVVVPLKDVTVKEDSAKLAAIPATTSVQDLVQALNRLGVTPRDLIAILQSMRSGGYITAELEVQ